MYNQLLTKVSSCKYLGVYIDEDLSWKTHINHVCDKLRKLCGLFYKIGNLLPTQSAKILYFSLVHSQLQYSIETYANTYTTYLDKLHKLNNKIIRILFNKPKRSTAVNDLYRLCDTLPIYQLHNLKLLQFVHKCVYHSSELPDLFTQYYENINSTSTYTFRKNTNLKIFRYSTNFCQRSCKYKGAKLWNSLPTIIKEYKCPSVFSKAVRLHLFI